jgi:membrane-associated PAP2 superfamily phosphatase
VRLVRRIPRRYGHFVFGAIQSGITCGIASAIANAHFVADGAFATHWLHSYLFSWLVMLPVVVFAAPFVRRLTDGMTQ